MRGPTRGKSEDFKRFITELKSRLSVSEVVGQYMQLKRYGHEFKGLSPFTQEKTPSFTINDQKQFWHCFSSNKHGDVISFLTETQHISFIEAVELLAKQAGLEMPRRVAADPKREQQRKTALETLSYATQWFQQQLSRNQESLDYLSGRGVSKEMQKQFKLGLAPAGRGLLRRAMQAKGFDDAALLAAGLIIKSDNDSEPYDRFRNRIMFPIENRKSETIAFGARALEAKAQAKYLNSPETDLFHKGEMLYGLPHAIKPAFDQGQLIIVEGYMDVIALCQAGLKHVVASLGTALTEQQIQQAWRLADEPIVCLDGDTAGQKAAERAMESVLNLLTPGKSLRFAFMPSGKDPDDVVRQSGLDAFLACVEDAQPLSEALYFSQIKDQSLKTPERKAALQKRFDQFINAITDPEVQRYYRQHFRARLDQHFWRLDHQRNTEMPHLAASRHVPDGASDHERILLGLLIAYPQFLKKYKDEITNVYLAAKPHELLRDQLLELAQRDQEQKLTLEVLYQQSDQGLHHLLDKIYGRANEGQSDGYHFYRLFAPLTPEQGKQMSEDFAETCLTHFLDKQYHYKLKQECQQAHQEYLQQMDETSRERYITLTANYHSIQEILDEKAITIAQQTDSADETYDYATLYR